MQVVGLPGVLYHVSRPGLARLGSKARERSRYVSCFRALMELGLSSTRACEVVGIPRSTLYRWERRWREEGLQALEDRSRRPKRRRQPTWSWELSQAVLCLREQYPRWGKDKLVVLLCR